MKLRKTQKVPTITDLTPRKTCKYCHGRGTLLMLPTNMNADKFRVVMPCGCLRKVVEWKET